MRNPFVKKTSDGKWIVSVCDQSYGGFRVWVIWARRETWREAFDEARAYAADRFAAVGA